MEFAIAKVSTKGQIVIPSSLREDIHTGDEFLMIKDHGRIILKFMKNVAKDLKNDIIFAERIEKSWQEYKKGKFVSKPKKEFLKELQTW